MKRIFAGWEAVASDLHAAADDLPADRLNAGQRSSLRAIAKRLPQNGILIADEVGMGKTRIAVETANAIIRCGGRVAILVPPGLGFQWEAELREGGLTVPGGILRSLHGFIDAWDGARGATPSAWYAHPVVLMSHAFTNWRLGGQAASWRWALLPELYAHARRDLKGRLPRYYNSSEQLNDSAVRAAAADISREITSTRAHPASKLLNELIEKTPWPGALDPNEYARNANLRPWLEQSVGMGLGVFDLVIIDEAHKSRDCESSLSRILDGVVLQAQSARRFALTATPVELSEDQWQQTMTRIGVSEAGWAAMSPSVSRYASAVRQLRHTWRSSESARIEYRGAAAAFQKALSPYVLRRDKKQDSAVKIFSERTRLPFHDYRLEKEISIETLDLPLIWQQAVVAAEALSVVAPMADDSLAKRLRLTFANGHGIAAMMDRARRDSVLDATQEKEDLLLEQSPPMTPRASAGSSKRAQRTQWWSDVIGKTFESASDGDQLLFRHPAICAAVKAIEAKTAIGEKVLVFGRFTRPMRVLTDLLNAREMLRRLSEDRPWPRTKVHGVRGQRADESEWPAVIAAHQQLGSSIDLSTIDDELKERYERRRREREKDRDRLVELLHEGLEQIAGDGRFRLLFEEFRKSVQVRSDASGDEHHPLVLMNRALLEHLGDDTSQLTPADWARAFVEVLEAATDRDEGDTDGDGELNPTEASKLWIAIEERLHEEFNRQQGGHARFMYGDTRPETRRMIQLAFNRLHSFPQVLVAQSTVGREGLNLHKACRTVVLLHPEWNPGVVEQQIGRVDRVGSHWESLLNKWEGTNPDDAPRIEVRPVVFRGTYDDHNWKVLRDRWDDYRAQLHGIVVPSRLAGDNDEDRLLIESVTQSAPTFSPSE